MKEEWRPVVGYEGHYEVSDTGRVKSLKRVCFWGCKRNIKREIAETILSPRENHSRYLIVNLHKNGQKTWPIHKLVAMSFLGHIPNGFKIVVDHIDGNVQNNNLNNLQLLTNRENVSKGHIGKTSSKYTGVYFNKRDCVWLSRIQINGKRVFLGAFKNEDDAGDAYKKALYNIKKLASPTRKNYL
jgi:hypothetical protein